MDNESLKSYANALTRKWIETQVQYFPNAQRVIDYWIIMAYELFNRVIVDNDLPITDMPPVLVSQLIASQENKMIENRRNIKSQRKISLC